MPRAASVGATPSAASSSSSPLVGVADGLLSTVLDTRLRRKAKSAILSSLEFLAVDFAILRNRDDGADGNDDAAGDLLFRSALYGGAIYAALMALFLLIHSVAFMRADARPSERVEMAYARTNRLPLLDGILELPFPFLFGGSLWFLPYLAWLASLAVIGTGSYAVYAVASAGEEAVGPQSVAALSAAVLLLYQVTSDFSEYWVQSRSRDGGIGTTTSGIGAMTSGDGGDYYDAEASRGVRGNDPPGAAPKPGGFFRFRSPPAKREQLKTSI